MRPFSTLANEKSDRRIVDREEAAEQERQLLLERWNRYKETDEGLSHETIINWLETWGTDKESSCPIDQN